MSVLDHTTLLPRIVYLCEDGDFFFFPFFFFCTYCKQIPCENQCGTGNKGFLVWKIAGPRCEYFSLVGYDSYLRMKWNFFFQLTFVVIQIATYLWRNASLFFGPDYLIIKTFFWPWGSMDQETLETFPINVYSFSSNSNTRRNICELYSSDIGVWKYGCLLC